MREWTRKILAGDARALARAATGIENRDQEALAVLAELGASAGRARVVGITGPPGAGKSTLVDAIAAVLRTRGASVAVVAVDPSSRRTGGAILGDRIRMQRHHADPGIFIRSMATRGITGGLARATADMALLMDAAGKDWVLIETVGVGQDEIEIAELAPVTVVVLVPGMGDGIQAIKAGIMEIADIFVVNKADQPGANRVEREIELMLGLAGDARPHAPVVRTVATEGKGIDELLAAVERVPRARPHAAAPPAMARFAEDLLAACRALGIDDAALGRIVLRVPDPQAAAARLLAAGARPGSTPPVVIAGDLTVEFMEDSST